MCLSYLIRNQNEHTSGWVKNHVSSSYLEKLSEKKVASVTRTRLSIGSPHQRHSFFSLVGFQNEIHKNSYIIKVIGRRKRGQSFIIDRVLSILRSGGDPK